MMNLHSFEFENDPPKGSHKGHNDVFGNSVRSIDLL